MFTGRADKVNRLVSELPAGAAVVGEITEGEPGKVEVIDATGQEIHGLNRGWAHFARLND